MEVQEKFIMGVIFVLVLVVFVQLLGAANKFDGYTCIERVTSSGDCITYRKANT